MTAQIVTVVPVLLLLNCITAVCSQECPLPTKDEVRDGFNRILDGIKPEGQPPSNVDLYYYNFNCLAVGFTRDTYRSVAVTGIFFDLGPENVTMQIDLVCFSNSQWFPQNYLEGPLFDPQTNVTALLVTPPSTNCASCKWMSGIILPTLCTECHPNCSQGLMYCTGVGASDCCGFYEDNVCIDECPEGKTSDADFNCVCKLKCLNGTVDSNCSTCTCIPGYTGDSCDQDINECISNPCLNGSCVDGLSNFTCECSYGFTGMYCETNIDDCSPVNPCQNGGTCDDGIGGFVCSCIANFTGPTCDMNVGSCASNPCENEGTCENQIGGFTCECAPEFTGMTCESTIDYCKSDLCLNNGTCSSEGGNFSCTCASGYSGVTCEQNLDDCKPNPCENNGTCIDGINEYTCTCVPGFTGVMCQEDIDHCNPDPCKNGTCIDETDHYSCECDFGFTGLTCQTNVDDCTPDPCQNGTCMDEIGSYSCDCDPGYTGPVCNINIDNCLLAPCKAGNCIDLIDDFLCDCPLERTGDLCENCVEGYIFNQTGHCVKNCEITCSVEKDSFLENICVFYCELKKWYDTAIAVGLSLPAFEGRNSSLSDSEQWSAALAERERLSDAWRIEAMGRGLDFAIYGSSSGSSTGLNVMDQPSLGADINLWMDLLTEYVKDQTVWEHHVQALVPSFPMLKVGSLIVDPTDPEGSSQLLFDNLVSNWTSIHEAYISHFGKI